MQWFKRLMCNHAEVDMENLDKPLCKHCRYEFPKILTNSHGVESNPKLEEWFVLRNLPKYKGLVEALHNSIKKVKDD